MITNICRGMSRDNRLEAKIMTLQKNIWSGMGTIFILILSLSLVTSCFAEKPTPSPWIVREWSPEDFIPNASVRTGTTGKINGNNYFFLPIVNNKLGRSADLRFSGLLPERGLPFLLRCKSFPGHHRYLCIR